MNLHDQGIVDVKEVAEQNRKDKVIGDALNAISEETGIGIKQAGLRQILKDKNLPTRGIVQEEYLGTFEGAMIFLRVQHR